MALSTGSFAKLGFGGITYSDADALVKMVDSLTITATFSEPLADAPVVKIAIAGSNTVEATDMTMVDSTHYTYTHAVGAGDGPATVALSVGTDVAGNTVISTPTSGATFIVDNIAPAVSIASIAGDDYINDSEKSAVHVVGTAEEGSAVAISLTDSTATTATIMGTATGGAFDITIDATALADGTITPSVTATDAAGNMSDPATTPTATKDVIAPTVSSITTKDADENGSVDTATIVFSEAMKDSTFSAGAWTIGGTAATMFDSDTADDATVDLSHAGVAGTKVKDVTYAPGTVTDLAGNPLAAVDSGDISEIDAADPIMLSAQTTSTTSIDTTWSEDLNGGTINGSGNEFTLDDGGHTVSAASETAPGIVTLTTSVMPTDATPTVTFSSTNFEDLAGNDASSPQAVTAVDGIAPTLSSVHIESGNAIITLAKVGDTATLSFTASESIGTPTITIDGVSATTVTNPSGNDWTATYTFVGGETDGTVPFSISFSDLSTPIPNAGTTVTATGDESSVFFDEVAPTVNAGADKEVNTLVAQDATVFDADPASGVNTYAWTQISGPGTITFSNPSGTGAGVDTDISADTDGMYILRLTVTDNAGNSAFDEMTFIRDTVRPEPLTSAPSDGSTGLAVAAGTATVTYDEDIALLDSSRVLLVDDATGTSYKGAVAVSGGNGASPVLTVEYSGLAHGTKYRINVKPAALSDVAGNGLSSNFISYFTTVVDTTPPVVNSASAGSITTTSAVLSVTTDEAATCRYATTDSAYASMTAFAATGGTSHSRTLTGLAALTGYDYFVRCQDTTAQLNTMTTSAHISFTTLAPAPDTDAPPAPSITTGVATVNSDSYTVSGTAGADTPGAGVRTISVYNGAALAGTAFVPVGQTGWSVSVTLTQDAANSFTAVSTDAAGNASPASPAVVITEDATVGADTTAPDVPSITTSSATVDNDTYEIAGTEADDGGVRTVNVHAGGVVVGTAVLPAGETGWTVTVTLAQNTANTFTAMASDDAGNASAASASVAITEATATDTTAPVITNIQAASITQTGATITWNTDELATSRVEYGPASSYGSLTVADATADNTGHSVALAGLSAGTEYHFRVVSVDALGNTASSTDGTFVTAIDDTAALAVTGIDTVRSFATADGAFEHGWKWTYHVTVPTSETSFKMKFSDFISGAHSIPAATNIRFYSAQSSDAPDASTAKTIVAADTYGDPITLNADLASGAAGRQIDVTVEMRVPSGTAGGSYSGSYGIFSSNPII